MSKKRKTKQKIDSNKMKLNLGSGEDIRKGWVNADQFHSQADVKMDFNKKFPFKDNTFDEVLMIHALEHSKDVTFTVQEIIRVCKPNAKMG